MPEAASPPHSRAPPTPLRSFVDPTNDTVGLDRYLKAVDVLFDGAQSELKLKDIRVVDSRTIRAEWTLAGVLKFPWRPRIQSFDGAGATARASLSGDPLFAACRDETRHLTSALARPRRTQGPPRTT